MKRLATGHAAKCHVCGMRAYYTSRGKAYCVRNDCQLVAAGQWTRGEARRDLRKRGHTVI